MAHYPGASIRSGERGQGLTEYLIILALIAIAAIGVYSFFGQSAVRQPAAGAPAQVPAPAPPQATGKAVEEKAAGAVKGAPVHKLPDRQPEK